MEVECGCKDKENIIKRSRKAKIFYLSSLISNLFLNFAPDLSKGARQSGGLRSNPLT
jgi:hypothetical protein